MVSWRWWYEVEVQDSWKILSYNKWNININLTSILSESQPKPISTKISGFYWQSISPKTAPPLKTNTSTPSNLPEIRESSTSRTLNPSVSQSRNRINSSSATIFNSEIQPLRNLLKKYLYPPTKWSKVFRISVKLSMTNGTRVATWTSISKWPSAKTKWIRIIFTILLKPVPDSPPIPPNFPKAEIFDRPWVEPEDHPNSTSRRKVNLGTARNSRRNSINPTKLQSKKQKRSNLYSRDWPTNPAPKNKSSSI